MRAYIRRLEQEKSMPDEKRMIDSTSDDRTVNNTLRQEYRVLSDKEKELMARIKSCGQELLDIIAECGGSRELSIAKTKTEEAVMWAVKHVTA
jgi:hypothetical protein